MKRGIQERVKSMKKLLVLGAFMLALIGCREEHRYEYRPVELSLFDGKLKVIADGQYGPNYEQDGKKMLDYGYPYHIRFAYVVSSEKNMKLPDQLLNFQDDQLTLVTYSGGKVVSETLIRKGEEQFSNLEKWLLNNSTGWQASHVNYVPEYIIRGTNFSIRKNGRLYIVIYDKGAGNFVQLEKEI